MARAMREIKNSLKKVDLVVELRDARLPLGTHNPELSELIGQKKSLIVLNKAQLIAPSELNTWLNWFEQRGQQVVPLNSFDPTQLKTFREQVIAATQAGRQNLEHRSVRLMIVGLPNTGKSTLINHLAGSVKARAQDRPGLTQGQQWISLEGGLQLLDTPGIMRPKIEDEEQALALGAIHSLREELLAEQDIAFYLLKLFLKHWPETFHQNYDVALEERDPLMLFELIAKRLGHIKKGQELNLERTAKVILHDYRQGKYPALCLEKPPLKG